jgi:hypothetical protein
MSPIQTRCRADARIVLDGIELEGDDPRVPIALDGARHQVAVTLS